MAIYGWSDMHVDYPQNMAIIESIPKNQYAKDSLLIAGDVTDRLDVLTLCLNALKQRFADVFFVPGNHDLWLHKNDFNCSIKKFHHIMALCQRLGILTEPKKIQLDSGNSAWIVPLFSWYTRPEFGNDSLFIPKEGEDPSLRIWSDNYRTKWPSLNGEDPACYFFNYNQTAMTQFYDAPVISFSHFLPCQELIFPTNIPIEKIPRDIIKPYTNDPYPEFNFTRVAGTSKLQQQIDKLPSHIHLYGHQHRNKVIQLKGKTYVSHCMGYPQESQIGPTGDKRQPLQLWPMQ